MTTPRARRAPPQDPSDKLEQCRADVETNFPDIAPELFPPATLDEPIGFGQHRDSTWYELLTDPSGEGYTYLHFLVSQVLEEQGPYPTQWRKKPKARIALWVLKHGETLAGEAGQQEDMPF